jgi:hypothetical protein
MARAIVLLVAASTLVLFDDVLLVLVDREAPGYARLFVRPHAQTVEVNRWRVVDEERGRCAQRREILARQLVDAPGVRIGAGGQIDLGARHVQEAERIARRQLPRFVHAHDIVGNRGHCRRRGRGRAQSPERMEGRHWLILELTAFPLAPRGPTPAQMRWIA